jgi:hypothetical protein
LSIRQYASVERAVVLQVLQLVPLAASESSFSVLNSPQATPETKTQLIYVACLPATRLFCAVHVLLDF